MGIIQEKDAEKFIGEVFSKEDGSPIGESTIKILLDAIQEKDGRILKGKFNNFVESIKNADENGEDFTIVELVDPDQEELEETMNELGS